MRLDNNEYGIDILMKDDTCKEAITISKEALEKLRDHYLKVADGCKKEPFKWGLYVGKADVLIDLLKHFEEDRYDG